MRMSVRLHAFPLAIALAIISMLGAFGVRPAQAQNLKTKYQQMAPIAQYLMDRNAEIALARSAAPRSVSAGATVMVLGPEGYTTAVKGGNGFLCIVERSWGDATTDPGFWDPTIRGPICFNPAAATTFAPIYLMKTKLVLAGKSRQEIAQALASAFNRKELPALEPGTMCYMLSKQQSLNDGPVNARHWHPHLMFFYSRTDPAAWGAGLPGSPIFAFNDTWEHLTTFLVPVREWSDGTGDH